MNREHENFNRAAAFYFNSLEIAGYSVKTVRNYRNILDTFAAFLADRDFSHGEDLAAPVFMEYMNELKGRGVKTKTIEYYMRTLERFFRYVSDAELGPMRFYDHNPLQRRIIPKFRTEVSIAPYSGLMTEEEFGRFVAAEKPLKKGLELTTWKRNKAIAILLVTSGMRSDELCQITPADFDLDAGTILVKLAKGKKTRLVPLHPLAEACIKDYLASGYRPASVGDTEPIFGARPCNLTPDAPQWKKLSVRSLLHIINTYTQTAIGRELTARSMRHNAASLWLASNAQLIDIQRSLGHTSLERTQIYAERLDAASYVRNINTVMREMAYQTRKTEHGLCV